MIVKYDQLWLDVIVDQLAHAWNSNNIIGFVSQEDILIKVFVGAQQIHHVIVVGGIRYQFRPDKDIETEFIHDICRYDQLSAHVLFIIMFQGRLNIVHELIVPVIFVFHVETNKHVQFWLIHQLRQIVQVWLDIIVQVLIQVYAQDRLLVQVIE